MKSFFPDKVKYSRVNSPDKTSGQLSVGLKSLPFLIDHGFQDMIVLPGSMYIEMAANIFKEKYGHIPETFSNIQFNTLIIISEEELDIEFSLERNSENNIEFKFNEKSADLKKFTNLSIELNRSGKAEGVSSDISTDDFIRLAKQKVSSSDFYSDLRSGGNQYGPVFRNIKSIWINDDEALCSFDFHAINTLDNQFLMDPVKLDSFSQLLSVLNESRGRTFILSSIDKIKIYDHRLSEDVWCIGKVTERELTGKGFIGDLTIFDRSSREVYMQFSGVRLNYLEESDVSSQNIVKKKTQICISATFTAEPVEQSLLFWSKYFNRNYKIEFAPYNQVFQTLLDFNSLFHLNTNGINVILLGLEDWANPGIFLTPQPDSVEVERLLQGKNKYTLPNKLVIAHLNKYETDYVYKEIFEDKVYLKHGISLNDGDTVIDIGANIGLFTLFVNHLIKNAEIYSFEPSPIVYELLKTNSSIYGANIKTFNVGVSEKKKAARFTFYNNSSVFSGFNADEGEDRQAIQAVVRNMLNEIDINDSGDLEEYVEELTSGRLESQVYDCQLISVSDIIADNHLVKIDLLKIDAEKSELEILKGINDSDWDKIKQIVIEIHDKTGKIFEEVKSILVKKGFRFEVEEEKLLQQSGLYNIYAKRQIIKESYVEENRNKLKRERLEENLENFNRAFHSFANNSNVPVILGVCERSPDVKSDVGLRDMFNVLEEKLFETLSDVSNVIFLKTEMINRNYSVKDYYDPHGNELGHIPYTQEYFTALGTSVFRRIFSLRNSTYKVIALDCDNTLWKGVCGEDGVTGIQISEPYRFLQQFIIEQIEAGMLVCLCSKNNEEDVFEIFDKRDDMILKRDHLVSWKLNWNLKSENLKSLAEELSLGLDAFIFIDDNPVECGEVKINCPDVLTLQLPQDESKIKNFLNNVWALDHLRRTEEDKRRTKMYKENLEREKYRESVMSLQDFLLGLRLNIKIASPTPDQINRVSQLTFRTNQFNFTTIRRTESEVNTLLSIDNNFCLVAEVNDRFGDYGLVGVLFYTIAENSLIVDTFLLSCRVLGREVEHKILSEVGEIAHKNDLKTVQVKYIPSPKNRPALDFIEKIGKNFKSESSDGYLFTFPVDYLVNLNYEPVSDASYLNPESGNTSGKNKNVKTTESFEITGKLQFIADIYNTTASIFNKLEASDVGEQKSELTAAVKFENDIEEQMFEIWNKILGKSNLGLDENFFEIGGTSLKAVQLIAAIKKKLNASVSVVTLFECPTINLLSKKISAVHSKTESKLKIDEQVRRGARRRQNIKPRKRI